MDVRDLITELLYYDLDATIDIGITSAVEDDDFEFEIEENRISQSSYVSLKVNLTDYVLVNKNDFSEMEEQIDGLESEVDSLRDMLAER
ncbi:hypothetical protein [Sporosarcina newyorkensis]|uniref:hypothetical protein n=1 Tax=Sporosarcina newyorkensis TaxID=759851 RepID=UPI003D074C07